MWIKQVGCGCPGCGSGPCDTPAAPAPTLNCEAAEVSNYKDGYPENAGFESTPPKIYTDITCAGLILEYVYGSDPDCSGTASEVVYNYCDEEIDPPCAAVECQPTYTATTTTFAADEICRGSYPAFFYLGTITRTLIDEYTTSQFVADAVYDLGSASYSSTGDCSAVRDLASDELSIALRKLRYKFTLPTLTGYTCYRITWNEGATAKEYVWNGSATETDWYYVDAPASNGTVEITDVEAFCDGC